MVVKGFYFPLASYGYFSLQKQTHRQHLSVIFPLLATLWLEQTQIYM